MIDLGCPAWMPGAVVPQGNGVVLVAVEALTVDAFVSLYRLLAAGSLED